MMNELSESAAVLTGKPPETDSAEGRTDQEPSQELEEASPQSEATETASTPDGDPVEEQEQLEWQDAWYDVEIPGLGMTAGEFKDRAKQVKQADEMLASAEAERIEAQNEALQARETLQVLVAEMGIQPTQQQIAAAQRTQAEYSAEQDRKLAEVIPNYAEGLEADREFAGKHLFSAAEFDAAQDWRFRKMIRDYRTLNERVNAAVKDQVKPNRNQAPKTAKRTAKSDSSRAVADFRAGKTSQQTAVAALLGGANK